MGQDISSSNTWMSHGRYASFIRQLIVVNSERFKFWKQTVQYGGVEGYWGVFDSKSVRFQCIMLDDILTNQVHASRTTVQ
jgi:hypothetical protein